MSQPPTTGTSPSTIPDPSVLRRRLQATWASGDFARIGSRLQLVGERLCESVDLRAGQRVLDVAAGNGNAALAAARCGCDVVAADFVPELLHAARRRAEADGLPLATEVAAAEELPFATGTFDSVLSTFGVMFASDHASAARELARVCRPGGRIGLASWTPAGFLGDLFRLIASHVPPPAGLRSPMVWGTEDGLRELLGAAAGSFALRRRHFTFRYRSAEHFLDEFRTWYGPTLKAFAALPPEGQESLAEAILALLRRSNRATDGSLAVPAEYLEAVVERAAA
ncbi:MAG: methyltransferase domain-containing protein [Planctomycetes bacterium]|nr:methyltransferase domain-containing protein [Planctomycetota bacterium]